MNYISLFNQIRKSETDNILSRVAAYGGVSVTVRSYGEYRYITGPVVYSESSCHGVLLFVRNTHLLRDALPGWDIVPLWISTCGAAAGVVNTYPGDEVWEKMDKVLTAEQKKREREINSCLAL